MVYIERESVTMDDSLKLLEGNLIKDGKPFEFTNEEYIGRTVYR